MADDNAIPDPNEIFTGMLGGDEPPVDEPIIGGKKHYKKKALRKSKKKGLRKSKKKGLRKSKKKALRKSKKNTRRYKKKQRGGSNCGCMGN
jgi:hypothetical protein